MISNDALMKLRFEELQQQVRDLQTQTQTLQEQVASGATGTPGAPSSGSTVPTGDIVNQLRNSDFTYPDSTYNPTSTYAAKADRPADWYARLATTATQFTENNGATESPESVKLLKFSNTGAITTGTKNLAVSDSLFVAGDATSEVTISGAGASGGIHDSIIDTFTDANHVVIHDNAIDSVIQALTRVWPASTPTAWNRQRGTIELGGGWCIASPLIQNLPDPGKTLFGQAIFKLNSDAGITSLPAGTGLQFSLWDNTSTIKATVEGAVFDITGSIISGAGAVTRYYILEVVISESETFFSNVASPLTIASTPDPTNISPGQIKVSWQKFSAAFKYRLWRADSVIGATHFYLVEEVETGVTEVNDNGGRNGTSRTIAAKNQKALAIFKDFSAQITTDWQRAFFPINVPTTYNKAATTDKLWLRIDFVDSTGAYVAVDPLAVAIDRVGWSNSRGNWAASSLDIGSGAQIVSGSPDPTAGGGGGDPGDGGGGVGGRGEIGFLPF